MSTIQEKPKLEYARQVPNESRISLLAILALPVGILSFPLLLPWFAEDILLDLAKSLSLSPTGKDKLLLIIAYLWPISGLAFSLIAFLRVHLSKGRLRGGGFALSGIGLALLWLVLLMLANAFFSRRGVSGP